MRKSGILMHISSLPNNYGIGTMGKEAYNFVDYLKKKRAEPVADTSPVADQLWRFPLSELQYMISR